MTPRLLEHLIRRVPWNPLAESHWKLGRATGSQVVIEVEIELGLPLPLEQKEKAGERHREEITHCLD